MADDRLRRPTAAEGRLPPRYVPVDVLGDSQPEAKNMNETTPVPVYTSDDKRFEARRAGLLPADPAADTLVLAARAKKLEEAKAARAAQIAKSKQLDRERRARERE